MSWLSTEARPLTERVTVTLCPDASVPEEGETSTLPIRLEGSVMDHVTGPPDAVRVRLAPVSGLSRIVVGFTLSVPGGGGGGGGGEEGLLVGVPVLVDGAGELGELRWLDDGALGEGDPPGPGEPPGPDDGEPPGPGEGEPPGPGEGEPPGPVPGDTRETPLADTVGCADRPGRLGAARDEAPEEAVGKVPELLPGTGPRAFDRPWWAARPPPSARPAITTAAATTAAPATTDCVCRARHRSLGGSSGLGKPWCPNVAACCATLARWATASGVSLLASLSTCARSPCGMAAHRQRGQRGQAQQQRRGQLAALAFGARRAPLDVPVDPLAHQDVQLPVPVLEQRASDGASVRPERATSSAPREISSWSRARESSACAWLRETPSTAAISATSSSCRNCSSIRSCSPVLRPRTAERSSARNSARSAPPVTSADLVAHFRQKVQGRGACACVFTQATVAFVGHGIQPWPETALITQSRQLGRRDDEGVLHGVRSIGGLVQQGAAVGVQRRRVPVIGLGQPVRVACHNGRNDLAVKHRDIEPRPGPFGQYRNTSGLTGPPYLTERREHPPQNR